MEKEQDIERIKSIVAEMSAKYRGKGGEVRYAGIEDGDTVRIAPAGFCWR